MQQRACRASLVVPFLVSSNCSGSVLAAQIVHRRVFECMSSSPFREAHIVSDVGSLESIR